MRGAGYGGGGRDAGAVAAERRFAAADEFTLASGDIISITIEGIGTLTNQVA